MATPKGVLRIVNGNACLYNLGNQIVRKYYIGGNATRVDWFEPEKESVQVQLSTGEVVIINIGCQIVKRINS